VIQTPKLGAKIMRYELADFEWAAIKPVLPNKQRGVSRVTTVVSSMAPRRFAIRAAMNGVDRDETDPFGADASPQTAAFSA
jgi:hypothetical protein